MINAADVIQLILVCAIIFIPAGYILKSNLDSLKAKLRFKFAKPRFIKPFGTLYPSSAREDQKHDA